MCLRYATIGVLKNLRVNGVCHIAACKTSTQGQRKSESVHSQPPQPIYSYAIKRYIVHIAVKQLNSELIPYNPPKQHVQQLYVPAPV